MEDVRMSFCKCLKGEDTVNPFEESTDEAIIWASEKCWTTIAFGGEEEKYIMSEYTRLKMNNFSTGDGIPPLLKAIIFKRYLLMRKGSVDEFKTWYKEVYLKHQQTI